MSTDGPAPDRRVAYRAPWRPAADFAGYVVARFPPLIHVPATLLTFLAAQLAAVRIAGGPGLPPVAVAAGGTTFVLLFFQLRLFDDIDDHDRDERVRRAIGGRTRASMIRWAVVVVAVVAALNTVTTVLGAVSAALATVLAVAAPLLARTGFGQRHRVALFVVYEGAPAAALAYACTLQAVDVRAVAPLLVLTVPFWCGYQVWKMSRKLDDPGYRPYGLDRGGQVRATAAVLGAAALAGAGLLAMPGVPPPLAVAVLVVPVVFLVALGARHLRSPRTDASVPPAPWWSGLTFVVTFEVLLAAVAVATAS